MTTVLDSGALSRLSERSTQSLAFIAAMRARGLWPPLVPSVVVAESIAGRPRTDAAVDRFLKACEIREILTESTARRAGALRGRARRGSVVDAVVVALAEGGGTVLTTDRHDLEALGAHADDVMVEVV